MKKAIICWIFLTTLLLSSCGSSNTTVKKEDTSSGKSISVATSFYPVNFLTKAIGGNLADVVNITPAGAEPHDYEPSVQDRIQIENSNMFVMNGGVEVWGEKLLTELKQKGIVTVVAGKDAISRNLEGTENQEGMFAWKDPHVWLSPKHAKIMAKNILDGYLQADVKNSEAYKKNASDLLQKLDTLDQEYTKALANCKRKDIVTSHAAFGYLSADYGLNQIALAGISPEVEPSAESMAKVVNIVRAKHIPVIFSETLVSPKLSETVARETGAKTLILNPLEGLTSDEISAGDDYFSVMRANLTMLTEALECK